MSQRYPCPCCGHRTLDEPPPGTLSICPVCFWEDTLPEHDLWSQSNGMVLREAQRSFAAIGACGESWSDDVRPPTPEEKRPPGWMSLDEAEAIERDAALAAIDGAFGEFVRGDGMRVYEAELADDYGYESPRTALRRDDRYQRYDEIPDEVIARHYSVLSFFDPEGFRFHVAAWMRFALRRPQMTSNSQEFVVYALEPGEGDLRQWSLHRFSAMNDRQAAAVVAFLEFTARHVPYCADNAQNALDSYWRERVRAG